MDGNELRHNCLETNYDITTRLAVKHCKKYHPAVIYCVHGFHFYKGSSLLRWLIYYPVEKWLSKYTDVLITVNKEDYDLAIRKMKAKEVYITKEVGSNFSSYSESRLNESQVGSLKEQLGVSGRFPILFYAAEISKLKNQRYLIEVVKILQSKGFNPALLLPGDDATKGKFLHYLNKNRLGDFVKLLGFRSDLPQVIQVADVVTPSSLREGIGLNLVEAMAAKKPVVAVSNRGHREVITNGKNGFLVSAKHPEEMADSIIKIISDKDLKESFLKAGYDTSKEFGWETVFPKLFQYISSASRYTVHEKR